MLNSKGVGSSILNSQSSILNSKGAGSSILNSQSSILNSKYGRWLEESVAVLARNNRLQYNGESYSVVDATKVDMEALWNEWDEQKETWLENPDMNAVVTLVDATMRALPKILTGKTPATDIMFPDSSMELVEGIYKSNRVADYFNESLAEIVSECIRERIRQDASAGVRILEIGAGTGGASVAVFKKLEKYHEHIEEYCYTDVSKAFLMHAEKEYAGKRPWLTCKILDVEKPISRQGADVGGYDIVIAANVLHATANIRRTLRNAKAALKNNGLIFLNEISGNSLFAHLTFGLLEGWWLYEDPGLRIRGCPGLAPETWQRVLESEGFRSVFFPAKEAHDSGQQIIVAESDGVVRRQQVRKQAAAPVKKRIGIREPVRKSATIPREKTVRQNG
ncbi:MAG: methyltransferase, partial [Gammaproteobacteria bacterium]|nr:methyltransferase [Gammaproteobacteria bacterium]